MRERMAVDMGGLGKGRIWGELGERKQKKSEYVV